jgi:V8-like Glu-specific endopeptidase
MKDGIAYTYISADDNAHLADRIEWFEEAINSGQEPNRPVTGGDPLTDPAPDSMRGQMVVGSDSRVEIPDPHDDYPWTAVGKQFLSNHTKWGTFFMVGPSTAVSVAHAYWDLTEDDWFAMSYYALGSDNGINGGTINGDLIAVAWSPDWTATIPTAFQSSSAPNDKYYDIAVIEFDDDIGDDSGWLGIDPTPSTSAQWWDVNGYPATIDEPNFEHGEQAQGSKYGTFGTSWTAAWTDAIYANWYVHHVVDTSVGNSGSPLRDWFYAVSIQSNPFDGNCPSPNWNDCNGGVRLGSVWLPFLESNTSWEPDGWGGSSHSTP